MSDETDRLADLGVDEELDSPEKSWEVQRYVVQERKKQATFDRQRELARNRANMQKKRKDSAYRAVERQKNRDRMRKFRDMLTNRDGSVL